MAAHRSLFRWRRLSVFALAGVPVLSYTVYASSDDDSTSITKKVKLGELPIYSSPEGQAKYEIVDEEDSTFRRCVSQVRRAVWTVMDSTKEVTDFVKQKYDVAYVHTTDFIHYVQSDPGVLPRAGVITVAGLGGLVAGYRGGVVKKATYSSISMLAAAALCYPNQAVALTTDAYDASIGHVKDVFADPRKKSFLNSLTAEDKVLLSSRFNVNVPHQLKIHNFKYPTWCDHCTEFVWGIYKQGLKCEVCGYSCHERCQYLMPDLCGVRNADVGDALEELRLKQDKANGMLLMKQLNVDVAHGFQVTSFMTPTWCDHCGGFIIGVTKQGVKCQVCGTSCHHGCEQLVPSLCGIDKETITKELKKLETKKTEPATVDPSLVDVGQSKAEDKDLYTTRGS